MGSRNSTRGGSLARFLVVVGVVVIAAGLILPELAKRRQIEKKVSSGPRTFSIERGRAGAEDAQTFVFKFEPNEPLLYAITSRLSLDMDIQGPGERVKTKMGFEMRYRLKLTLKGKSGGDVSTVRMEPSGVEGDWDLTGPSGHVTRKVRGSDVIQTQDGVTTVDTRKGIGLREAKEARKEMAALHLSGEMDIDSKGNVIKVRGDVPFVEFWTGACEGQLGLMGVVFPEKPIATGDSWKGSFVLKKLGKILLEAPGLRCTVRIARQPDITVGGRTISRFTIAAPFKQRNLVGYTDQGGKRIRVNIPSFDRSASGTARFDAEKGALLDSNTKTDGRARMKMSVSGETAALDMVIGGSTQLRLLPR